MAVECSCTHRLFRSLNALTYLRYNRGSKCHVWHKMTCDQLIANFNLRFTGIPSIISICSQSAPQFIASIHSCPRAPKSADRMEGAIMADGAIFQGVSTVLSQVKLLTGWIRVQNFLVMMRKHFESR